MNIAERTKDSRISLNGYKTVDRDCFPGHWSADFIQELARRPGWIRYFPWTGSINKEETEISETLYNWRIWHGALIDALEVVNRLASGDDAESAINGIRHSMQTMMDEFDDILVFISKTSGKWEEPEENPQPVDQAS